MTADDPCHWHPELAGPRDPQLAAHFAAMLIGGTLTDGPPPPGSRLARLNAICDAMTSGQLDEDEGREMVRDLMREAIDDAEQDRDLP